MSGAYLDLGVGLLTSAADRYARSDYVCEPYPVPPGRGTHALPMMLLGVGEQLVRAGGGEAALAIVGDALDDLDARYWRGTDAAEVPRLDGRRDDASLLGRHRCPGHLLEAVWFVAHAADLFPDHPLTRPDRLAAVALAACELGWDAEHGGILRYVDRDGGRPRGTTTGQPYEDLVARTWDAKLWWTHAEALYALALVADLTQDADVAAWRDRFTDYTLATFPQGEGREWIQNRNRDGSPLDQVVALPVKDPLHVARALLLRVDLENHPSRHRREDDR